MTEDRGLVACKEVSRITNTVILKFSGGKDSVSCWLRLKDHFERIYPIFHYWCPGLEFVERTLEMYEKFFDQDIIRAPHPNFLNFQASGAFQYPHRIPTFDAWNFDFVSYDDVVRFIAEDYLLHDYWTAIGIKSFDSPIRQRIIAEKGALDYKKRFLYPVCDMSHKDAFAYLETYGCPLSRDYEDFGRSFDGFQYRYIKVVKERYPEDYKRILRWFPLIEAEFMRAKAYASEKEESSR